MTQAAAAPPRNMPQHADTTRISRRGSTLLELVVAAGLLATVLTAVAALLRFSEGIWQTHDNYLTRVEAGHAVLRHITRSLRQAVSIQSISPAGDTSGALSAMSAAGDVIVWEHSGDAVHYGVTTAGSLLAEGINELSFVGYQADGTTMTTAVADIRLVRATVVVSLPNGGGGETSMDGYVWLRAW